jgi:endonuclease III
VNKLVAKYKKILSILKKEYEIPPKIRNRSPLDELILVILSQNTSDNNSEKAFDELFKTFKSYDEIASNDEKNIAKAIKQGGLSNIKAKRIKGVLEVIHKDGGDYTLEYLKDMSDKDALKYLMSIDGVGAKSARCVLLFSLGLDFMPVDTHVFRVSKRIGLISKDINDREKACDFLESFVQPEDRYRLHMCLIYHGRTVCKARKPDCDKCSISKFCDYASLQNI